MRQITRDQLNTVRQLLADGEGGTVIGYELGMSQPEVCEVIELIDMIDTGYQFYCSTSGGKDSQAMYIQLLELVPRHQITLVHADLGEVEWHGVQQHIHKTTSHELHVVRAIWADGSEKNLLGMVEKRGMWPSSAHRQCTSDLKRGPIYKFIRGHMKSHGFTRAVNCMGLRAGESAARAKLESRKLNKILSKAGREVYDWLPIHDWSTEEVFEAIAAAGQEPHPAYATGNERLSCMFCIMGSTNDLQNAARQRPELAAKMIALEEKIGHTFKNRQSLKSIIATDGVAA